MKRKKLCVSICLVLILSMLIPPFLVFASNVYCINGVYVRHDDYSSSPSQCWVYANYLYGKIWGENFSNQFGDSDNMLRNLPDSELTLTPEHLRKYVSQAELGSCLRICNEEYLHANDGWGHSQIIVQKDENGFTVFQGGLSSYPYRNEAYYTWESYCSTSWLGKYDYIKYIKWPGAQPYHSNRAPIGEFENVQGDVNSITVKGWTYDKDDIDSSVMVHIYVDGTYAGALRANEYRPDINEAYGGGDNHGFEGTIRFGVDETGEHTVELYALDLTYGEPATYLGSENVTVIAGDMLPDDSDDNNPFKDVSGEAYYYDAVLWALEKQITAGVSEDRFMPDSGCTRAEAVTFLWRASGMPEPQTAELTFKDVPENAYYTKAILWATEEGITSGYDSETFGSDDQITRCQFVSFLWRMEEQQEPVSEENQFIDVVPEAYYYDAVLWAVENNITAGYSEERFEPDMSCTRCQVVSFLYRAYK